MDYLFIFWLLLAVLPSCFCATVPPQNNSDFDTIPVPKSRSHTFRDVLACWIARDTSCFLDAADAMVEERMNAILVQADSESLRTTGRADEETSPSLLSKAINRIISEFTEMFKDSLSGFFKSAREGEDDDDDTDEDDEESDADNKKTSAKSVGEARKKKKGKLIALIKLIILGIVLKAKITLLLKALSAALQIKFFLVALAGLILNAARFYLDLKKGHKPQKVIYYEHAQHQHHYEGDDDWASSGPDSSYWGRSYDEEEASAHDLAYAKQKPYKKSDSNKSSFSWFG